MLVVAELKTVNYPLGGWKSTLVAWLTCAISSRSNVRDAILVSFVAIDEEKKGMSAFTSCRSVPNLEW